MIPKLTGNLFRAGRALAGLTRDDLAARTGLSRDVLRSWEISSEAIVPAATYSHLCRVADMLEGQGARFSGDGVSALSGDLPDYLVEAVPPPSTANDSKGLHLGMDLAARVRHAGLSRARHEQELQSARVLQWFATRVPSDEHFHSFSAR
jgi:transcriptional regulator with XRE-family HTH domain